MKTPTTCAVLSLFLVLTVIGGCGTDAAEPAGTARLELNVDLVGNTELAGMRIDVTRVYCDGEEPGPSGQPYEPAESYQALESVEEVRLPRSEPAPNNTSINNTYAEGSIHPFSDHIFNVSVGCYDLTATPLKLVDGEMVASEVCSTATLRKVYAAAQTPNEFQLFSQCL